MVRMRSLNSLAKRSADVGQRGMKRGAGIGRHNGRGRSRRVRRRSTAVAKEVGDSFDQFTGRRVLAREQSDDPRIRIHFDQRIFEYQHLVLRLKQQFARFASQGDGPQFDWLKPIDSQWAPTASHAHCN